MMTAWGKPEWRRWAKERRSRLELPALSRKVVMNLQAWPAYRRAEHVLSYVAFAELDLSALREKHFYTTRTHRDGTLSVHALSSGLERHPYGFYQPVANSPEVELGRLELLLIPGLAFDLSGNRLGYGKGFYDRLLARIRKSIPVVGVVPSELIVASLPAEPHDVKMTHLLSETGIVRTSYEG